MSTIEVRKENPTVLITGVTGQDGSYLAELLTERGCRVIGLTRDVALTFGENIEHLRGRLELQYCSYTEASILDAVLKNRPNFIYNLAGQTYVAKSWDLVEETIAHSAIIPIHFLNAILRADKSIKFFQASTSEIFKPSANPMDEDSPLMPTNPYGCSKAFAHNMVNAYRAHHGLFAVNGIFFHHESPRRHPNFLSRKVVQGAVQIKLGKTSELLLGNLTAARDWGYAPDYMDAATRMMDLEVPTDFVIATGESRTVQQLVEIVFNKLGLDWKKYVRVDPKFSRSYEVETVRGNPAKAKKMLNWEPTKKLEKILEIMIAKEFEIQSKSTARESAI
jgi:GDPmannose 4,6-dehydratase